MNLPVGQLSSKHRGTFIRRLCFVLPQLTARLDILDEHSCFATPPSFTDNTCAFSPEKSASFAASGLKGHVPDFNAILTGSDQYLGWNLTNEEPEECSKAYSPFAELGSGSNVLDEPVEAGHYQEPPMPFGDSGDMKMFMKVTEAAWYSEY